MILTAISYPNNNLNYSEDVGNTFLSSEIVKYFNINIEDAGDDEYIEVTYNDETITLLITDECKYEPIDIFYQNKEGAESTFTFFKKSTETIKVNDEDYESNTGQPLNGYHQKKRYNVQANQSISVNTGFIAEENNEIIKQILLSERVWKRNGLQFIPLLVASKSLEYKTQSNDKLINYSLDFDYAFNEINSI